MTCIVAKNEIGLSFFRSFYFYSRSWWKNCYRSRGLLQYEPTAAIFRFFFYFYYLTLQMSWTFQCVFRFDWTKNFRCFLPKKTFYGFPWSKLIAKLFPTQIQSELAINFINTYEFCTIITTFYDCRLQRIVLLSAADRSGRFRLETPVSVCSELFCFGLHRLILQVNLTIIRTRNFEYEFCLCRLQVVSY